MTLLAAVSLLACRGPEREESDSPPVTALPVCEAVATEFEPVGPGVHDRWIRARVHGLDAATARFELVEVRGDDRLPVTTEAVWDPDDTGLVRIEPDEPLAPNGGYELGVEFCDGAWSQAHAFRTNDVGPPVDDLTPLDGTHWLLDVEQGMIDHHWGGDQTLLVITVRAAEGAPVGLDLSYFLREDQEWLPCPYRHALTVESDSPWLLTDDIGPTVTNGPFPGLTSLQLKCAVGTDPLRIDSCTVEGLVTRESTSECAEDWFPCDPCPWSPDDYDIICLPNRIRDVPAVPIPDPPPSALEHPACDSL